MKSKKIVNKEHTLGLLLNKYKKQREAMIIMDDYDGGQARQLDETIKDLTRSINQDKYNKT